MGGSVQQLVQQAVAGDEAALTALLERHGAEIRVALERAYRQRLKGEVDLDDVMQVTYLEAFLRVNAFVDGGGGAFRAWLSRIAENNLRDAIRKSDARDRREAPGSPTSCEQSFRLLLEPLAGTSSPSRGSRREELRRKLERAMRQLPADYQRVLRLYDVEGHSGPEVASQIGRSHGAVKMLVARAREHLCELLGPDASYFSSSS